jgi:hypothetical protein
MINNVAGEKVNVEIQACGCHFGSFGGGLYLERSRTIHDGYIDHYQSEFF